MGNVCSGNASKSGFLTFSWCSKSAIAPKDDKKESSKNGKKEESSKDNKKEESSKDSKNEESSKDVKKEPSNGDEVGCKETEVVAIHEKPPEPMKMAREEAVQKEEPTKPVEEAKVKLEPKRQPTRLSSKQASRSTALNEENKSSVREKPASHSSRFNEENNPSKPEKPASQSSRFNEENKPSETEKPASQSPKFNEENKPSEPEKPASLSPRFHGENKPSEPEKPASQSSRFHEECKPSEPEKPASLSPRFHEENKPSDPEKPGSQSSRFHEENKPSEPEKPKKPKHEKRSSCAGLQVEFILQTKTGHLKEYYELGKKLGHGQFGTTFLCVEKGTGKEYACKSIAKRKLVTEDDVDDVKREIQIMHHLAGHPNVVSIRAAYEDSVAVHVVMELCTGGELFDRIIKKGHYTESKAAGLTRTIVGVIESCHSMGVMHRDLKPENFLFVNEDEDSALKAIDFGLSIFFKPGDIFKDVVGSPYYVAPEVLKKRYGPEADVWSAGVILYILLSGVPPFWGETEKEIFDEVFHGQLDFKSDPWPKISESAKDLIRKMLVRDPKKRISAHEVLCDPWVQVDGVAPDKPLDSIVLSRLKQFSAMNKLKKMALRVIAQRLSEDEIAGLKEIFKMIDTDNSGQITFEELKEGLKRFGADLNETEFHDLMQAVDVDKSGTIDYAEFVAATLHLNKVEKEEHLFAAFSYFDKDGSGYITQDELQQACQEFGIEDVQLEEMIQDADQDNDGRIDYNEFVAMMQKGNAEWGKKELQGTNFGIGFREASPVS